MTMKTQSSKLLWMASVCASTVVATAGGSVAIPVTIRDFAASPQTKPLGVSYHPDFQVKPAKVFRTPGLVNAVLGGDNTPVYSGIVNDQITSAGSFSSWFHDNATYNVTVPVAPLVFNEIGNSGIYAYVNPSFFPINGLGFGNYTANKNYHFTLEMHQTFTYALGQQFAFLGDDDIWVFINNQLVIDIGGIHPARPGFVDLDTLGLTPGNNYKFDLFYAERHTSESNFKAETSIVFKQLPEADAFAPAVAFAGIAGLMGLRRRRQTA
jgi:fibro-slime domain-containing protein